MVIPDWATRVIEIHENAFKEEGISLLWEFNIVNMNEAGDVERVEFVCPDIPDKGLHTHNAWYVTEEVANREDFDCLLHRRLMNAKEDLDVDPDW